MRTRTALLCSVSAIATATAAVGIHRAEAEDAVAPPDGYTFSVQGGMLFSGVDSDLQQVTDKTGSGLSSGFGSGFSLTSFDDLKDQTGLNAAFTVGKKLDDAWDIEVGGTINVLGSSKGGLTYSGGSSFTFSSGGGFTGFSGLGAYIGVLGGFGSGAPSGYSGMFGLSSGYGSGRVDANFFVNEAKSFDFEAMDFSVGFTPKLDESTSVRLFAGIRALRFASTITATGGYGFDYSVQETNVSGSSFTGNLSLSIEMQNEFKSTFFGVGPRIGGQFAKRFDGSNWGISGLLAGAAIYGRQTDTTTTSITYSGHADYTRSGGSVSGSSYTPPPYDFTSAGPTSSSSYSEDKWVFDVQAKAGVDYFLSDNQKLTFGYQAEQLFNVGPVGNSGPMGDSQNHNKMAHGPFVALTGSFD